MMRRGLTLIELLVAVLCTAIVGYMAWNLVRDEQTNYTRTREKIRLQSDAKEAMRIIEGEMRNLGFNHALVTGADRRYVNLAPCAGAEDSRIDAANGDFSSFRYTNSAAVPGGDVVEFRMHQGTPTGMQSCTDASTPLQSISYRFNAGRLERRFCQGADVATCPTDGTWIPFLDSVVSFHVQYGVETPDAGQQFANTALATAANWVNPGQLTATLTTTPADTNIVLTGFTSATRISRFLVPVPQYRRGETFLVSFRVLANSSWLQDGASFGAGFFQSNNNQDSPNDSFSVQPGYPVNGSQGWQVSMVFNPNVDNADGQRYFGVYGRLVPAPVAATPPTITIRNLQIRKIGQGRYINWIEAPTVAQKNLVRAVRVSLLVKSRRSDADPAPGTFSAANLGQTGASYTPTGSEVGFSYILMQRIIPVVNNGTL